MSGYLERAESAPKGNEETPLCVDDLQREIEQLRAQLSTAREQLKLAQSRAVAGERALSKTVKRRAKSRPVVGGREDRRRRGAQRRGPGGRRP